MKIKIEYVDNGWILYHEVDYLDVDEKYITKENKILFSYDYDTEDNKLEALKDLLYTINDMIGEPYSKHKEKNITINIE